ncbi:amino acid-binding protein [Vulcanisaeta sp. JCM 16159]|uniref:amino acid-binding protein n=1 Tax=Vulcanisaeta sp. JCM 16159 TaxID=1295371 RepID=UPI0006CFF2DB|nr:amino acid-binding protein [Vulcanisaeta sp. JCM 16159]
MVWLLVSISKDRPGLLNDITSIIRSQNLNIRNIVGNNYAILIEIDGKVNNELVNNVGNVDGVNTVSVIDLPFTILGLVRENFMKALVFYVMEREPELIERLGYEYGKELMRCVLNSRNDVRVALYTSLEILTALGVIALASVQFMSSKIVVSISRAFDEDVGMPLTRGIIKGLFEVSGSTRYCARIERDGFYRDIVITC